MHINIKLMGWVVVALVVAGAAYSMFTKPAAVDTAANIATNGSPAVGSDLLELLGKLQTVNFNTDLFSDKTFVVLKDFAIPLPTPNLGRPNPFEKIGTDIGQVVSPAPVAQTPSKTGSTTPVR
jgi:hypothetical protein